MVDTLRRQQLYDALASRILIIDGAMGTMLQAYNPTLADFGGAALENCNENLCLTRPEWIRGHPPRLSRSRRRHHRDQQLSGLADRAGRVRPGRQDARAERRWRRRLARQAADEFSTTAKPRFVAGSMGPTTKSITLRGDVTLHSSCATATTSRRKGLVEGGVDILLIETGVRHAQHQGRRWSRSQQLERELGIRIPIMVSGTIERWGAMLAGQPVDAFYASVAHADLLSIGLNCATGPDLMTDHIRTLAQMASTRISCYPNAGLPNEEDKYLETPESLAAQLEKFVEHGWLNIVGGCCGTTPAHIRAIAQMAEGRAPHAVQSAVASRLLFRHRTGRSRGLAIVR